MGYRIHRDMIDAIVVELDGPVNCKTVPGLRKELFRIAGNEPNSKLRIDFSMAGDFDTACVAMLVELLGLVTHRGGEVRLSGMDDNMRRMVRLARLDEAFGLSNSENGDTGDLEYRNAGS